MTVLIGLAAGFAFGLASAFSNRVWGTVLACLPMAAWFVVFVLARRGGLNDSEAGPLCLALFGIVVGVFSGQLFERRTRKSSSGSST
ncbi:hypothetical protein [Frigoribacterium sp. PhB24]|uniref:hypothetical protein n=1 Tax=Frigoribacterium sp. PhB24 TaxID=2485204 RepID=UPI000F477FFA|nr:hypothetical protein [Frigoribacterium sp. PhB24]ROS49534.1 hypothetical protein EDF50_2449 [Frigoribacterium sp. PhB24]